MCGWTKEDRILILFTFIDLIAKYAARSYRIWLEKFSLVDQILDVCFLLFIYSLYLILFFSSNYISIQLYPIKFSDHLCSQNL